MSSNGTCCPRELGARRGLWNWVGDFVKGISPSAVLQPLHPNHCVLVKNSGCWGPARMMDLECLKQGSGICWWFFTHYSGTAGLVSWVSRTISCWLSFHPALIISNCFEMIQDTAFPSSFFDKLIFKKPHSLHPWFPQFSFLCIWPDIYCETCTQTAFDKRLFQ